MALFTGHKVLSLLVPNYWWEERSAMTHARQHIQIQIFLLRWSKTRSVAFQDSERSVIRFAKSMGNWRWTILPRVTHLISTMELPSWLLQEVWKNITRKAKIKLFEDWMLELFPLPDSPMPLPLLISPRFDHLSIMRERILWCFLPSSLLFFPGRPQTDGTR